jgi:hypothetical protein
LNIFHERFLRFPTYLFVVFIFLAEEADAVLAHGLKCFPNPAMMLVRAHYNFAYSDNHSLGLNMCSRSEQRSPFLDEQFTIFFYRKLNEESFTTGDTNTDVLSYLKFQHTMNFARRYDEACSRWQVRLSIHS